MSITLRAFAKINLGLNIGPVRADGFHQLRTVYQTLALHDVVRVEVQSGSGIEIRCNDPRVPLNESNTCYKAAERVLKAANASGKVIVQIDKRLPVQGGLGAGSSNAAATILGLERALEAKLSSEDKLRIAAEVGSDVPLFLIGGTVLGVGRGEEVYALPDLPRMHLVVVTPPIAVSTPKAFARWDERVARNPALTGAGAAGTINKFGQAVDAWLSEGVLPRVVSASEPASGVPAMGGDRAETLLLDLVRAGIENDFERVVFPEYPDLREVKRVLEREGARYASLSGSGSTLYGVFDSDDEAQAAAARIKASGHAAVATTTLTREKYCKAVVSGQGIVSRDFPAERAEG
jgi:4-diphosphocytidyl-2-C-methyl-D-erythritol kinase